MGTGIDLARVDNPDLAEAIDNMKDQLLILLLEAFALQSRGAPTSIEALISGAVVVPIDTIDHETKGKLLMMEIHRGIPGHRDHFIFEVKRKQ